MQLNRLTLTQFRAFEQADFDFHPGMNLIVGINGVGKSSVLDALRIMLSQVLPKFTASKSKPLDFETTDITVGRGALTAELEFNAAEIDFQYLVHKPRQDYVIDISREGEVRDQTYNLVERQDLTPDEKEIPKSLKTRREQPLVVYFSTRRSLYSMAAPSKQFTAGGQAVAFADALKGDRELRPREFAEWWLVQEVLIQEGKTEAQRYFDTFESLVRYFLENCSNLRAVREPQVTLMLNKAGVSFDVRQLSDGERGILALVLDLARRLSWANPKLDDPLQKGKAIVLIDELDLHLHPRWQRSIVEKLTRTFQSCQFIATTHSPQIIGEVSPENILILENGELPYQPEQSLGMDSNWVLSYLMEASERDIETKQKLKRIADLIEDEEYDRATDAIDDLRVEVGEFPELVRLQTRIDRIRLLGD
ncbi:AAA family ATPase [Allocoleopsis franciscana]|uniref:Putative ATP-binding protein involved in virulence n=1 Tax=Allocoleopsis franciscana PCC 7113 TaxID=1173027 RepID=K9WJA0_9CYAN|nr:AAA family ATPase [Allocoleopsis franciscana]AFZ20485.1 putative ATP-binding protein involved in virulence [Allocoleopsis franciscana PCC 7113]